MRDYLFFAGKSTNDFNVYITDAGVYEKPDRNYEKIPVPGRNGDLIIENDKYENKPQNYPAVIMENFDENFDALMAFLLTQKGYQKLSDTFHPDIFYLATFDGIDKLKHTLEPKAGSFVLKFNRKPQRFLVSGEKKTTFTNSGEIKNPTLFDALPLIFVIGIGILEIGNVSVKILQEPGGTYTGIYIDSDLQEAYVGDLNCNGMIELVDGKFPVLNGGINEIKLYGFDYKRNAIPTLSNYPAASWTTDAMKREHIGDTYLRTSNNKVYKFTMRDTYTWEEGSWDDIKENGATLQSADIIPRWWKL